MRQSYIVCHQTKTSNWEKWERVYFIYNKVFGSLLYTQLTFQYEMVGSASELRSSFPPALGKHVVISLSLSWIWFFSFLKLGKIRCGESLLPFLVCLKGVSPVYIPVFSGQWTSAETGASKLWLTTACACREQWEHSDVWSYLDMEDFWDWDLSL